MTLLYQLYVALIRGPRAGKLFMSGESIHPQTETMAGIHNIRSITLGAIATCAILVCYYHLYCWSSIFLTLCQARWALSADDTLQEVGSSTGIRYFSDFEEYLMILETGLQQKKKSVINIIRQWDEKIFPDSDSSLVKGNLKNDENSGIKRAMALLAADSEEELED